MEIVKNLISWCIESEHFDKSILTLEKMIEEERDLFFRKIYQHLEHMYISGERSRHSRIKNGINESIEKSLIINSSRSYEKYKCLVPISDASLVESREFFMDKISEIESSWIALILGGPIGRDHEYVQKVFSYNKDLLSPKKEKLLTKFLISDKVGYWLNINNSGINSKKTLFFPENKSNRKLKIGVMISGQMRGYSAAFETWKILFSNHDVDYFVSTWKLNGSSGKPDHLVNQTQRFYFGKYSKEIEEILDSGNGVNYEYINNIIKPPKIITEDEIKKIYGNNTRIKIEDEFGLKFLETNAQKMYYKIESAFSLIESPYEYDLLVRIRPDIVIENNYNEIIDIMAAVASLPEDSRSICTGYGYTYVYYGFGIDDKFAIGKPEYMEKYCKTWSINYNNLKSLVGHNSLADTLFENKIDSVSLNNTLKFRFAENIHISQDLFDRLSGGY
jgi:hypothetical protein